MATAGMKYKQGAQPIDYFNFLFADELLDLLAEETNSYAFDIFLDTSRSSQYGNMAL